jgi:hypothetical protein
VGRLHRLPHHSYQIVAQSVQICLVSKLGREGFEGLGSVVLTPVEATIHERLHPPTQRVEQRRYDEGRDDYGKLGLPLLATVRAWKMAWVVATPPK